MGILQGIFRSRDKPQNRTVGSNFTFFMGGSTSGKRSLNGAEKNTVKKPFRKSMLSQEKLNAAFVARTTEERLLQQELYGFVRPMTGTAKRNVPQNKFPKKLFARLPHPLSALQNLMQSFLKHKSKKL